MGYWYNPPTVPPNRSICEHLHYHPMDVEREIHAAVFLFNETNLNYFVQTSKTTYCNDALKNYISRGSPGFMVPFSFGDSVIGGNFSQDIPFILKSRAAPGVKQHQYRSEILSIPDKTPILGFLRTKRHYGPLEQVAKNDRPFEEKKNTVVWRGTSTGHGKRISAVKMYLDFPIDFMDIALDSVRPRERNQQDPSNQRLVRKKMDMKEILKHKYLLSLEGNDVASGLKWMLLSNSVVFMPPPTAVSWAMEDRLVPFYHYIPLRKDLTDLAAMVHWARQNDAICERISQQSTQYMMDLIMSPQAQVNHEIILNKTVERYQDLYGDLIQGCSTVSE